MTTAQAPIVAEDFVSASAGSRCPPQAQEHLTLLTSAHLMKMKHVPSYRPLAASTWTFFGHIFDPQWGKIEPDWLGAPMFFDNFHPDQTRRALSSARLVIVRDEVITIEEPGHGDTSFLWLLASKLPRGRR
jgi:hypothetical protein